MDGSDYFKGKPVAIVTVVIASDAFGVYSLGTLPAVSRTRIWGDFAATCDRRCAGMTTGLERSVLQSTQQGMNLYLQMGYRVVTSFSIYLREGCASF